ncbi:MAG TPA: enoyl-CoA hydratase-related protein [Lichenihabitans sp.]|nr:enoyl-CoA hydratase-related protein [Lichenihabitans sp.]
MSQRVSLRDHGDVAGDPARVEDPPSKPAVLLERPGGGVARVILNRPAVRNAVDGALANALERAVRETEADPEIRVVILTGAGSKAFCAGADLAEVARGNEAALWTRGGGFAGFVEAVRSKVWIAAVKGFALAGGLELMLACDLVVAAEDATFGLPEVKRGLVAGAGGLFRLPRALPRAVAIEMIVTGESIGAGRALALGLINRVAAAGQVDAQARDLARIIAANAPCAVRDSLRIARIAHEGSEADLSRLSGEALSRARSGEDSREGARAFLEKREPRWSGR